jgi:hypothetical protein
MHRPARRSGCRGGRCHDADDAGQRVRLTGKAHVTRAGFPQRLADPRDELSDSLKNTMLLGHYMATLPRPLRQGAEPGVIAPGL